MRVLHKGFARGKSCTRGFSRGAQHTGLRTTSLAAGAFQKGLLFFSHEGFAVHEDSRLDGLGDGADLVDLQQEAVAGAELGRALDAPGVGDRQVVPHHLDVHLRQEPLPPLPVVLVEGVLDRHHCGSGGSQYRPVGTGHLPVAG